MSQTLTFENALKNLYFGVDIKKASSSLVDTLMTVQNLHHSDTVVRQSNLNINMQLKTDKEAWNYRHIFIFTKSPLPGLKIDSGYIEASIGEAPEIKKLLGVNWCVQFDNKIDAEKFYNKLIETFAPLSTKQKTGYDKDVGHIAQYSTRKEEDKGIRDITFCFGKSPRTKKFEITLLLANEFMNE
ncbi:MAG: hypothetical protein HYR66_14710 [Sphingobacteriales bacterium]|nr:hypothetical protein [Sphingobacteriales bacterium]MBI3720648.1 hypothetical protein [Sphingobacteriales bacterium]